MASGKCRICSSPHRKDIESLIKKKVITKDIARHYAETFETNVDNLYSSLRLHIENSHPPLISQLPELSTYKPEPSEGSIEPTKPKTIEEYAQRVLDLGFTEEQLKKVNPAVIIQAQKVLIEKQKAENQRDALKLTMSRLFSGLITPKQIKEAQEAQIVEPEQIQKGGE